MKYIGPFLRINSLSKDNIINQMFHLSKEAIKHIVLESHCGIEIPIEELTENPSNFDMFKTFSPILCVYKKSSAKLSTKENILSWDNSKFKKQVDIFGNALMTLSLLELTDYYKKFKAIDNYKYSLANIYLPLTKKQLEFYASNLRNHEGLFVDKNDITDPLIDEFKFEEKNTKYKFSNQALLMAAYYKYSLISDDKYSEEFKKFSLDILNMFIEFRDELYDISYSELVKLCISLNIFYKYSKNESAKALLIDLSDLLIDQYKTYTQSNNDKTEVETLLFMNYLFLYKNTNLLKFKEKSKKIYTNLLKLYNDNLGIFLKPTEEKQIKYSSSEILTYLTDFILYSKTFDDSKNDNVISDIFKHQIINSGLALSWPDSPTLDDVEHYRDFSLRSEDLIDEQNFRLPTIATPENSELAPVFLKHIYFNKKKEMFKQSKLSFDSNKNMMIYFMMIYLYNHN